MLFNLLTIYEHHEEMHQITPEEKNSDAIPSFQKSGRSPIRLIDSPSVTWQERRKMRATYKLIRLMRRNARPHGARQILRCGGTQGHACRLLEDEAQSGGGVALRPLAHRPSGGSSASVGGRWPSLSKRAHGLGSWRGTCYHGLISSSIFASPSITIYFVFFTSPPTGFFLTPTKKWNLYS